MTDSSLSLGLLALAGTLLLSACNLGPHYVRPDIPAPAAWSVITSEASSSQPAPSVDMGWPDAQWWQGFGSAELDRLINQAQVANDDLKAAIARVQQSDAQVRIAVHRCCLR